MQRRHFLALSLAAGLAPTLAAADSFVEYEPGLIQSELDAGKTVLVDYSAKWCSTCARQARVIDALRAENPSYDKALVFVKVDWDKFRSHDVTKSRGVPRRSTLIVLRGKDELGRLVAATGQDQIKGLLDLGL